jgi:hypothetical protein
VRSARPAARPPAQGSAEARPGGSVPVPCAAVRDVAVVTALGRWLVRRLFPLLATAGLIAVGMVSTTWGAHLVRGWEAHLTGKPALALPEDLWATLTAARRLVLLDLGGLYTRPTGLVAFPGAALILVPVVAVIDAAGLGLAAPGAASPHPAAWLLAGPYEMALSGAALFAADSIAERLGAARPKRALLAAAGAVALGNVSLAGGHPEDAVAVALFLFGVLALSDSRAARSAWLIGAAVAVQPLVLLALPIALAVLEPRRLAGYLARAAAPSAVLLGAAAAANWKATLRAVTSQPNWPAADHPTPWAWLAPHVSGGGVAAGPSRVFALVLVCGCALVLRHRWRLRRPMARWSPGFLAELLWWVAAALATRCVFEPVMVAYYLWPALAVALVTASRSWPRLITTSLAAVILTFISGAGWQGPWSWWALMVAGLGLTLFLARVPQRSAASQAALHPRPLQEAVPGVAHIAWPEYDDGARYPPLGTVAAAVASFT